MLGGSADVEEQHLNRQDLVKIQNDAAAAAKGSGLGVE